MLYYEDMQLHAPRRSQPYTVAKDETIAFAMQWDPQPYHTDEEAAKQWPLGLTASGLHTMAIAVKLINSLSTEPAAVVAGLGWDEVRMLAPVRPGDRLHAVTWLDSKRESASKPGFGILGTVVELHNQDDVVVLRYRISSLIMKKPQE